MGEEYILVRERRDSEKSAFGSSFEVRESLYTGDGLWAQVSAIKRGTSYIIVRQYSIDSRTRVSGVNINALEESIIEIIPQNVDMARYVAFKRSEEIAKQRARDRSIPSEKIRTELLRELKY